MKLTVKEKFRSTNTQEEFEKIMGLVPGIKERIVEILRENTNGVGRRELKHLYLKKFSLGQKISRFLVGMFSLFVSWDEERAFWITLEELAKEGRIREEKGLFYIR